MQIRKLYWHFSLFLPVLFFITGCSGGGGGSKTSAFPGASGQICILSDTQYTIEDSQTGATQTKTIEAEPFLTHFTGNMSGQIRAVASIVIAQADAEPMAMLSWGAGSSIQYGVTGATLGPLLLKHEGVVTDIISYGSTSDPSFFYGTEHGIGLLKLNDVGFLSEAAYKPLPSGVLSVAVFQDAEKTRLLFITADGYLLATTNDAISSDKSCFDILSSAAVMTDGSTTYIPVKVIATSSKIVVLSKKSVDGGFSPTFEQTFDTILQSLITHESAAIVRAIDISTQEVKTVAFAADNGLLGFDQFIPTDIASDGTNIYVAGLAYDKTSLDGFVMTTCDKPSDSEKLDCMRQNAKKGNLTSLKTSIGVDALTGGFFIYRDMDKLSEKASFFARVPITIFADIETAPALIFHMAINNDKAAFRAPNFLAIVSKTADAATGAERWSVNPSFGASDGLMGGVPQNLNIYFLGGGTYVAATFVGAKAEDDSGASFLEGVSPDGKFLIGDTGALSTRMEDFVSPYLVAIDSSSPRGGTLYLENTTERKNIEIDSRPGTYVGHAAYDGTNLTLAWSAPAEAWRLQWQLGTDISTRGQLSVPRSGDSNHYKGFPDVSATDVKAFEDARDIADMAFAEGRLFVLYYGFSAGKHYYQAGVYGDTVASGKNNPTLQGITNTISVTGDEIDRHAHFQKIAKNSDGSFAVLFSCAGGLRQFTITPSTTSSTVASAAISTVFADSNVMDLDFDDSGSHFAYVSNTSIRLRDISKPTTDLSASSLPTADSSTTRLSNASLILTSGKIFVATPQGAASPFWIIDVSNPAAMTLSSKCNSCHFNRLATFSALANQLLVSSETGGVEIYDISGI